MGGYFYLLIIAVIIGTNYWLFDGVFLPVSSIQRVLLLRLPSFLLLYILLAFLVLLAVHLLLKKLLEFETSSFLTLKRDEVRYFSPLLLLAFLLVPYVGLLFASGTFLNPISHLTMDLRVPFVILTLVLFGLRVTHIARTTWLSKRSSFLSQFDWSQRRMTFLVVALVFVVSLYFSPHNRYTSENTGDEPKYLRYCEILYQNQELTIDNQKPFDELPEDYSPRMSGFLSNLATTVYIELSNIVTDLGTFLVNGFRIPENLDRTEYLGNWLVRAKGGEVHQMHSPGFPFLIFPAYFVDRHFLAADALFSDEFPSYLVVTNLLVCLIFSMWAAGFFRVALKYAGGPDAALVATIVVFFAVPVFLFNFQYYPDVAAGMISIWIFYLLGTPKNRSWLRESFVGLLIGFLPWLHTRFSILSLIFLCWLILANRHRGRRFQSYLVPYVLAMGLLGLYFFHIVGSVWPTTVYELVPYETMEWWRVPGGLAGYLFERGAGILPYSLVFLFCIPGAIKFRREHRFDFYLIVALAASVVIPSAAHFVWFGGASTPGRLIVPIIPFIGLFLVLPLRDLAGAPLRAATFALLGFLSVHNGLTFASNGHRYAVILRDSSFSGWKTNLLFTRFDSPSRYPQSDDWPVLLFWFAVCVVVVLFSVFGSPVSISKSGSRYSRFFGTYARSFGMVLCFFWIITSLFVLAFGMPASESYRIDSYVAKLELQDFLYKNDELVGYSNHGVVRRAYLQIALPLADRRQFTLQGVDVVSGAYVIHRTNSANIRVRSEETGDLAHFEGTAEASAYIEKDFQDMPRGKYVLEVYARSGDDSLEEELRIALESMSSGERVVRGVRSRDISGDIFRGIRTRFEVRSSGDTISFRLDHVGHQDVWLEQLVLSRESLNIDRRVRELRAKR